MKFRPIETAPRDGRLLRLDVEYEPGPDHSFPLTEGSEGWTIGLNFRDLSGEDDWYIAGWDGFNGCFTAGRGKVVGWLPYEGEEPEYVNLPTVCVVLLPVDEGLLLIRRGKEGDPGYGELALPGGFQDGASGESIHMAACREVEQETGLHIEPEDLRLIYGVTDQYGHNVLFFQHENLGPFAQVEPLLKPDPEEVQEVVVAWEPVKTCFPFHTREVSKFFYRRAKGDPIV